MKSRWYLLNLDTGDFVYLGDRHGCAGAPEIGFHKKHRSFEGLPMYGHIASNPKAVERTQRPLEFAATEVHELVYFLLSSRGCRLVMISEIEFDIATGEVSDELGLDENSGPFIHWRKARNYYDGTEYFDRREAAADQRTPETPEQEEWLAEHRAHYRAEIKKAFMRTVQKADDFETSRNYKMSQAVLPPSLFSIFPGDKHKIDQPGNVSRPPSLPASRTPTT